MVRSRPIAKNIDLIAVEELLAAMLNAEISFKVDGKVKENKACILPDK